MKFHLLKNQRVTIPMAYDPDYIGHESIFGCTFYQIGSLSSTCDTQVAQILQKKIQTPASMLVRSWMIEIDIRITNLVQPVAYQYVCEHHQEALQQPSVVKGFIRVSDAGRLGIFEMLSHHYGNNAVKVIAHVDNLNDGSRRGASYRNDFLMSTSEENLNYLPLVEAYGIERSEIDILGNIATSRWRRHHSNNWQLNVTLVVELPDDAFEDSQSSMIDTMSINKKVLHEEVFSDVTLIPSNGIHIKCHKSFLAAHSKVLAAMFNTSMKESLTNTLDMSGMTEGSVRALLAYVYYWEVQDAVENSLICFELLHASHMYDMGNLEECMKRILMDKNAEWYEIDVALRLFLFSRNMPKGEDLKVKAVTVLKTKSCALQRSEIYQTLFQSDPKAAMELCRYAFNV